jgi:hypothetical protein
LIIYQYDNITLPDIGQRLNIFVIAATLKRAVYQQGFDVEKRLLIHTNLTLLDPDQGLRMRIRIQEQGN